MVDRGLRRSFDPAVEHEAREVSVAASAGSRDGSGNEAPAHRADRRDLRTLPTFTVDPVSARDFDDAISASEEPDGTRRIWVHIADVSAYVRPKSLIDREAYRRGTSVYVPDAVEPMLPEALSNQACSLVPGQDRLAVTVELVLENDRVRHSSFYRSVIRSDERLDYDHVDRIFAGVEGTDGVWGPGLASARSAAAALEARRASRGALDVDSSEPEFAFDDRGDVVSVEPVAQTESHRMIEHLMIAANEQVARFLTSHRVPTLYRVHERPDGASAERLIDQLASLGVPTPAGSQGTPHAPAGRRSGRRGLAARRAVGWRPRGARAPGADEPGASLLEAGLLRPAQPRPRRPSARQLLPLHLADPALSRPDLPPRAAVRGERATSRRRRRLGRRGGALVLGARARGDDDRARRRRHRPLLPARASRAARTRIPTRCSRARSSGWSAPARSWPSGAGRVRGAAAGAPAARRLVGAQRAGDDAGRDAQRRCDPARRPGAGAGRAGSTRRGAGWTCSRAGEDGLRRWRRAESARRPPATSRPTGRRPTGTTCSSGSSAGSC